MPHRTVQPEAAIRRRHNAHITTTVQLGHKLSAVRARHNYSVELRAISKLDHRFDDSLACGGETRLEHDAPFILGSPFPADWRESSSAVLADPE
jgi:hypothetical protein